MILKYFSFILLVFLSSCVVTQPKMNEWKADMAGPQPTDEQVEAFINDYVTANFYDPYSVRDLGNFETSRYIANLSFNRGQVSAWEIDFVANAKNLYGAYIGLKKYTFFVQHNKVVIIQ